MFWRLMVKNRRVSLLNHHHPRGRLGHPKLLSIRFFAFVFLFTIFLIATITYLKLSNRWEDAKQRNIKIFFPVQRNSSRIMVDAGKDPSRTKYKTILFWTQYFGVIHFNLGLGPAPFSVCPVSECQTTGDRSLLNQSDAVLFHGNAIDFDLNDLPPYRLPHQRWIFYLLESPEHTTVDLAALSDVFNWTMTYRLDSDIPSPYGTVESVRKISEEDWKGTWLSLPARKKKKVAWFVSNCDTPSKREQYVDELQKHIEVDIYGRCGELDCPSSNGNECYQMLAKEYKFYLSFENSICKDYVTEKFFNVLHHDVVPVVYGGADYAKLAPNGSYIDYRDFKSAADLAAYLRYLDKNDEEYLKYFAWRRAGPLSTGVTKNVFQPFCTLCEKLHDPDIPAGTYHDIQRWWFNEGQCGYNVLQLWFQWKSLLRKRFKKIVCKIH